MTEKLNFAVVPNDFIQDVVSRMSNLENILKQKEKIEDDNQILDSEGVMRLLKISRRTWQTYRDRKLIPFSQIGNTIWVLKKDIYDFLESSRIKGC